jgi:heat-inducible transcriptional repressor
MLSSRTEAILKSIVGQYIIKALPVSSGSITEEAELKVSSATIRNEMVRLEKEGYIIRPHHSSGSIPLDKGYRCYVNGLGEIKLPLAEQRMISHLFHQVEGELDGWLNLAATLLAKMVNNVALVTTPRTRQCQLKQVEVVSLQGSLALVILVLRGARVRQQLINFGESSYDVRIIANRLSEIYAGMNRDEIAAADNELDSGERKVRDCILKEMEAEDTSQYEEPYLDGLHFTLNQPELAQNHPLSLNLMELVEQRSLVKSVMPSRIDGKGAKVVIGTENQAEPVRSYSVVISQYGLSDEAVGTISVIGPTRMNYARTIATVEYLAVVLNILVARLYGKEISVDSE